MGKFTVNGGVPLFGRVKVSGSKNAALPVLFACIATKGISEIGNLPDISDVRVALDILTYLGARLERRGALTYVDTRDLAYREIPSELVRPLRASTYLLSSMLVRFGRAEIGEFGGCNFSPRPIDMHLAALASHGARIANSSVIANELHPSSLSFDKRSVGATVNALILASGIHGESEIRGCALEPHILTLIDFLRSAGAEIELLGDVATVRGGELSGGRVIIGGDMIEAGSMLALSVMSGGDVRVRGCEREELCSFCEPFLNGGCNTLVGRDASLFGAPKRRVNIQTAPYPGFPTDLQPIAAPLLSFCGGTLTDTVWQGRFGYLHELERFGVASRIVGSSAEVFSTELHSAEAFAPDLRGGMALLIAAIAADGISVIHGGEVLLRGYERLTEKLTQLGAEIRYDEE